MTHAKDRPAQPASGSGSHRGTTAARTGLGKANRRQGHKGAMARGGTAAGRRQDGVRGAARCRHRRIETRLHQPFRVEPQLVRLDALEGLTEVTQESLAEKGLVHPRKGPAKLLANGAIAHAISVRGVKVSAAAREKIVAAGGRIEE